MRAVIVLLILFFAGTSQARDMQLTIYDDGRSCPGGCDAHVVINRADNGSRYAFSPDSTRQAPRVCRNGEACTICFGESDSSCMTATYRGGGPPPGKFDFTPAFYDGHCARSDVPNALRTQCDALDRAVQRRGYGSRINCFADTGHPACTELLRKAAEAQSADAVKRDECLQLGEANFNARQSDGRQRRSNGCDYSQQRLGGPNSNGVRWRILLPGACRPNTGVGRDGLDCCSANMRFAASVHPECSAYFPTRTN